MGACRNCISPLGRPFYAGEAYNLTEACTPGGKREMWQRRMALKQTTELMNWVTVIWPMIASACLTLAAIYGLVWLRNRAAWAPLLLSLAAASTAALMFCELWGYIQAPIVLSVMSLGLVTVMGYELSRDRLRAPQLVRELQASQAALRVSEARQRLAVTARTRAEHETELLRQEVARAGRVSMLGQLASSLAHEINQPLGAILRNAEAAELYLQQPSPDLDEVRAILCDIRTDDERAGHVIDRMRGLLQRHTLETRRLDVSSLVRDVAAFVRVDAASRHVKLDVDVPGGLPEVRGDRVHLQQVLLNLILNGMDALDGARAQDRRVSVAAWRDGGRVVEIAVRDGGPGVPDDLLTRIFDPFFTTKPNGMGMGLAISRTIVEAHGGRLWAENRNGGGAAFRFTLPMADEAAVE